MFGRTVFRSLRLACARSILPSVAWLKITWPPVGFSNCRIARPVVDLPQPDSPTMANVSPFSTEKLSPSTAFTCATVCRMKPARIGNHFCRSMTSSRVSPGGSRSPNSSEARCARAAARSSLSRTSSSSSSPVEIVIEPVVAAWIRSSVSPAVSSGAVSSGRSRADLSSGLRTSGVLARSSSGTVPSPRVGG